MALIISNAYLTVVQMTGNAQYIANYLTERGWTRNAIAGILGNMQRESNINPGLWQSLKYGNMSGGYGLVQWTPATNYTNWASANGYPWGSNYSNPELYINGQLERILWELANGEQWIATSAYNFSFRTFTQSMQTPEYLATAFCKNYERAGTEAMSERTEGARYWFEHLSYGNTVVDNALEWALQIAADNSHGYDQAHRDGPDYDCSSFLSWAYYNAGLNTRPGYTPSTSEMYSVFRAAGFTDVTSQVNLSNGSGAVAGDVFLHVGHHTAMYIGNEQVVHASINEHGGITGGQTGDQTGGEICTRSYYNHPWDYVLRYKSGGSSVTPPTGVSLVRWIPA